MSDEDDNWSDDDGEGEGDAWGDDDLVDPDNDVIMTPAQPAPKKKEPENEEWKCLECNEMNATRGLLCLHCNKINLGELDRQRREWEEQEVHYFAEMYENTHIPLRFFRENGTDLDRGGIIEQLRNLYDHMGTDVKIPFNNGRDCPPHESGQCQVCFCDFTDDGKEDDGQCLGTPCHSICCRGCFRTYVATRLADDDIIPHIPCPQEDCVIPIPATKMVECGLSVEQLYQYVTTYCKKMLSRNSNWVFCPSSGCGYGWVLIGGDDEQTLDCDCCYQTHTIKRQNQMDEGFQAMVKEGKIRMCPACQHPHMKDKGICNVMQCIKCNVWWNWRTYETANTMRELKQRSRATGALWEPGELEYQQNLERDNPDLFRQLLERNGITYDPNYVRGS